MTTGPVGEGFQLDGEGPLAYERHLVPAFFLPCADLLLDRAGAGPGERGAAFPMQTWLVTAGRQGS